ncbi:hypothetical protein HZS_4748 [Henneguya salminicola]|nr:hypothetical protein HZS_4748 [Henneguya salminicola]
MRRNETRWLMQNNDNKPGLNWEMAISLKKKDENLFTNYDNNKFLTSKLKRIIQNKLILLEMSRTTKF